MAQFYVEVTNNNDIDLDDHYDGRRYEFPAGKKVKIPFDAACHIFGVEHPDELKDKNKLLTYVCRRWGWNTKEMVKGKEHIKCFDNIKITLVSYKVVRDDGSEEDAGMLPASRAMVDKSSEVEDQETAPVSRKGRPPMKKEDAA